MNRLKPHPELEQLVAFNRGELHDFGIAAVSHHLEACARCRDVLESLPEEPWCEALRGSANRAANANVSVVDTDTEVPTMSDALSDFPIDLKLVEDKYEFVGLIGAGGMGRVFHARHRWMPREMAIKFVRHQNFEKNILEAFRRESDAISQLDHPGIVKLYDADQIGDCFLLAMEFVPGKDLHEFVKSKYELEGELEVATACDYVHQALQALQHAAAHGIVHRDLKPRNLLLTNEGTVKIADFGLAKLHSDNLPSQLPAQGQAPSTAAEVTRTGALLGTLAYMAPEQFADARSATTRSDIYGLGGTLYYLLAGQPPHETGKVLEAFRARLAMPEPTPLRERRDDVPKALHAVLNRMMHADPERRYESPEEAARALAPFTPAGIARARRQRRIYGSSVGVIALSACVGIATILNRPPNRSPEPPPFGQVEITVDQPPDDLFIDGDRVGPGRIRRGQEDHRFSLRFDAPVGKREFILTRQSFAPLRAGMNVRPDRDNTLSLQFVHDSGGDPHSTANTPDAMPEPNARRSPRRPREIAVSSAASVTGQILREAGAMTSTPDSKPRMRSYGHRSSAAPVAAQIHAEANVVESVREIHARTSGAEIANSVEYVRAVWERRSIHEEEMRKRFVSQLDRQQKGNEQMWRRLRDFPELVGTRIEDGNALNFLLDRLSGNVLAYHFSAGSSHASLESLNQLDLSSSILHSLKLREDRQDGTSKVFRADEYKPLEGDSWPSVLLEPAFATGRNEFEKARDRVAKAARANEDVKGATKELTNAHRILFTTFKEQYAKKVREDRNQRAVASASYEPYKIAERFLAAKAGEIRRLEETGGKVAFDGKRRFEGKNLVELLTFMSQSGLDFAPAEKGEEQAYHHVFRMMHDLYKAVTDDPKP